MAAGRRSLEGTGAAGPPAAMPDGIGQAKQVGPPLGSEPPGAPLTYGEAGGCRPEVCGARVEVPAQRVAPRRCIGRNVDSHFEEGRRAGAEHAEGPAVQYVDDLAGRPAIGPLEILDVVRATVLELERSIVGVLQSDPKLQGAAGHGR